MSAASTVVAAQDCPEHTGCSGGVPLVRQNYDKASESPPVRLMSGDVSSSGDELNMKVRKPYTITKQRERWTENEHQKFLEALKLFGRAWRRIEEHIGTKTAVQIRSHAQKFFSKLEREASSGGSPGKLQDIEIPPPRPKRKPSHPYPRKAGKRLFSMEEGNTVSMVGDLACPSMNDHSVSANRGSCQPAAFKPYVGKGGPVLDAGIFHDNTVGSHHFFETEGSLKLFGKTVVVPTPLKTAAQEDSSEVASEKEIYSVLLFEEKLPSPSTQNDKQGFSPYVKVGKKLASNPDDTISSNISAFGSGLNTYEGIGESSVRVLVAADGASADEKRQEGFYTNVQCTCRRQLHEPGVQEILPPDASIKEKCETCMATTTLNDSKSNRFFPTTLEAGNMDRWFHSLAGSQSNAPCPWMDSSSQYYGRLPILPHTAFCSLDGHLPIPTLPWQFLQAAAISHPAAYAAAMIAAGWAGLVPEAQVSVGLQQANVTDSQKPSLDELRASEFAAAATRWWALRGMESLYTPAGAIYSSTDANLNLKASDIGTSLEKENSEEKCSGRSESRKEHSSLDPRVATRYTSSLPPDPIKISVEDNMSLPDYKNRPKIDNSDISMGVPVSVDCPQEVEKASVGSEQAQHSPCSSTDEMDGMKNNAREGSSSGSNTPIFGRELDSPNTSGSDVKDICADQCECSNDDKLLESNGCPKIKFKHSEKGKNHHHKDFRHGDEDHAKRFKSSAHDLDVRKGVSQEGRKAFQALFTCKILPQTFPFLSSVEDKRNFPTTPKQIISMSSTSTKVSSIIDVETASCLLAHERNSSGSFLKKVAGIANNEKRPRSNMISNKADAEETLKCQLLSTSKEIHSKMAMLSSRSGRSGFVPYKRPSAETKANPKVAAGASDKKQ